MTTMNVYLPNSRATKINEVNTDSSEKIDKYMVTVIGFDPLDNLTNQWKENQ